MFTYLILWRKGPLYFFIAPNDNKDTKKAMREESGLSEARANASK